MALPHTKQQAQQQAAGATLAARQQRQMHNVAALAVLLAWLG
jgi:hypothetical protein